MTELNRLIGQLDNIAERTEAGVSEKYDAESIREAASILRAAAAVDVAGLMELAAKAIYDQWADQLGWVEWVPGGNSLNQDEARSIARAALESALRMALAPKGWQPIETAPKEWILLLGYFNESGKWRTVRGEWFCQEEIDDQWEFPENGSPGWYETCVNADEPPNCWPIEPTHWMPLPAAPSQAGAAPKGTP